MKYITALLLGFLLLLPVGLIAMPRGNSLEQVVPSLIVTPEKNKFFGPSLASTYFEIDVILFNIPLSQVDVYAFDFDISWASVPAGWISLVNATAHSPFTSSFTIANGNTTNPPTDWHLSITATGAGNGLTNVDQSVLTLWFHINMNVCWPDDILGNFLIGNVKMSSDGTVPVQITNPEVDNGTFEASAPQPNMDLSTKDPAYNATSNTITECCVSHTFDVEVDLTNVTNVYGFSFTLTYPASYLETDAQHITFKAAFPPPYETLSVVIGTGTLTITLTRPSEKPTVQADPILPAVDIVFHSIDTVYNPPYSVPTPATGLILLTAATICVKCPDLRTYSDGTLLSAKTDQINYAFNPSPYDLNEDCTVDVQDLMVLLPYYGLGPFAGSYGFGGLSGLSESGYVVDIFDFVAIAKHFGPVPCPTN